MARGLDHPPSDGVDLAAADVGPDRPHAGSLSIEDQLVDLASLAFEIAGGDSARAVRAVTVDLRPPIDHHQLAGGNLDVAGTGVGQRTLGTEGHDRIKRGTGGAPVG